MEAQIMDTPKMYPKLLSKSKEMGFDMLSDKYIGSLLKTLVASKPSGNFLELGTGTGLSMAWMLEGMDDRSQLTSVDNDKELIAVAQDFFGNDSRVNLVLEDGESWLTQYQGRPFDLIFADAWPGKYSFLDETLELLKPGGFYVIDDMKEQANWPKGHDIKAASLMGELEKRKDITITKMDWSTGIVVAVKIK